MALAKCGHPGCSCLPGDGSEFCSDHCEQVQFHEPKEEVGCLCGHTGCDPRAMHHDTPFETGAIRDDLDEEMAEPRH
jgi:hypothetical protein